MIRLCDVSSERSGFNAVLEDLWLLVKTKSADRFEYSV